MNLQIPKKAAVINSFAGYGRCSLTEALPILSAMRVQACPVPTVLSGTDVDFFQSYRVCSLRLSGSDRVSALLSGAMEAVKSYV